MLSARLEAAQDGRNSGHIRIQEINLNPGWNAIFLEVDPLDTAPSAVFSGVPVEQAAAYFSGPGPGQFVSDATIDLSKDNGWGIWYAPDRPEAFLKSLDAIYGGQCYLIKASRSHLWKVTGYTRPTSVRWNPDSYNFVGFPVVSPGGPTFGAFFAGSKAHAGQAIYRLANNAWRKVNQPTAEVMKSGEAFWIYTKGSSTYQGPLRVELSLQQGLILGRGPVGIVLRNEAPHPLSPRIEHQTAASPPVPLSIVFRAFGDPAEPVKPVSMELPAGTWAQDFPVIETGGALAVPFECRGAEMTNAYQSSILKITSDLGTISWVPVLGIRDDLTE